MTEEPPKDLGTRAFQKRAVDEFIAIRAEFTAIHAEQASMRAEQASMRAEQREFQKWVSDEFTAIRAEQSAMREFQKRVIDELASMRSEQAWETVQVQLQRVVDKFDVVLRDIHDVRIDVQIHGRRLGELERRASEARP